MKAGNIIDNVPTCPILPLNHPSSSTIQYGADRVVHRLYFEPHKLTLMSIIAQINKRIKRIIGHEGPWIKKR